MNVPRASPLPLRCLIPSWLLSYAHLVHCQVTWIKSLVNYQPRYNFLWNIFYFPVSASSYCSSAASLPPVNRRERATSGAANMHLVSSSSGPRIFITRPFIESGRRAKDRVRNYIFIFVFLFRHPPTPPPLIKSLMILLLLLHGRHRRQTKNLCTRRNFAKRTTLIIVVRLITSPRDTEGEREKEGTHIFHAEGSSLLQEPLLLCRKGGKLKEGKRPSKGPLVIKELQRQEYIMSRWLCIIEAGAGVILDFITSFPQSIRGVGGGNKTALNYSDN